MPVNVNSKAYLARRKEAYKSIDNAAKFFARTFAAYEKGTEVALEKSARRIYEHSQILVPVSQTKSRRDRALFGPPGTLKKSGFIKQQQLGRRSFSGGLKKVKGGEITWVVGYNENNEAPYAVFVHEIQRYRHLPPTQWKFLEVPFKQEANRIMSRVRREIARRKPKTTSRK